MLSDYRKLPFGVALVREVYVSDYRELRESDLLDSTHCAGLRRRGFGPVASVRPNLIILSAPPTDLGHFRIADQPTLLR
jgi:hypothetical protein